MHAHRLQTTNVVREGQDNPWIPRYEIGDTPCGMGMGKGASEIQGHEALETDWDSDPFVALEASERFQDM